MSKLMFVANLTACALAIASPAFAQTGGGGAGAGTNGGSNGAGMSVDGAVGQSPRATHGTGSSAAGAAGRLEKPASRRTAAETPPMPRATPMRGPALIEPDSTGTPIIERP